MHHSFFVFIAQELLFKLTLINTSYVLLNVNKILVFMMVFRMVRGKNALVCQELLIVLSDQA
ncbi:hypothetical protein VISI1226_12481 [Vibrio sinaloensis DSM 21326]|uniref:Uncharacterized protein n=1 Tax=Vibrio sinaloensis DSM 21326 TaxID=945550 RepID=E8M2U3_PHOS4|nr:hypothetical protein VISI1226_12481 [Vibrio sinaloensis DSM 21326]